ncbi:hypothetical protein HK405_009830, partial [Cladochytrium tenue]
MVPVLNIVATSYVLARYFPTATQLPSSPTADANATAAATDGDSGSGVTLACDAGVAGVLAADVALVAVHLVLWCLETVASARDRSKRSFGAMFVTPVR